MALQEANHHTSQAAPAPAPKTSSGGSGGNTQLKSALVGKSYDVQLKMLTPGPVQKEDKPGAPAPAQGNTPAQGNAPAQGAPAQGEAPAGQAPEAPAATGPGAEIATAITQKRAAAAELVKTGQFDAAFKDLSEFMKSTTAAKPDETRAALTTIPSTADWLVECIGLYLKGSPIVQDVLKSDKGPAKGKDDKSADITKTMIDNLTTLQSAVEGSFPGDGTQAVKELTLRREMFKLFASNHDKSQEESGIGSAQSAVKGKVEQHVTSCNAYQGMILRQAFGNASAETSKEGGAGAMNIKKTTTYGWDMVKKRQTKGPKQRNFALYDSLGRAAKEVGAWTEGGPGLTPKAGDILIYLNGSSISHIGFFKFAEDCPDQIHQIWHTFDGGQIAGKAMTGKAKGKGEAAEMMHTVQDGALNNMKRKYNKPNNTIETPSEAELATLRGEEVTGKDGKTVKVNQDGLKRKIGGVIDPGKFIELDKKDAEAEAAEAAPNAKPS